MILVLSQFAGAAHELQSALIVNPYDVEAMADALVRAFAMRLDERKDRWHAMMAVLRANSVHNWASQFLQALANEAEGTEFNNPLRRVGVPNVYDKTLMGSNARSRRSSQMNSTRADA